MLSKIKIPSPIRSQQKTPLDYRATERVFAGCDELGIKIPQF